MPPRKRARGGSNSAATTPAVTPTTLRRSTRASTRSTATPAPTSPPSTPAATPSSTPGPAHTQRRARRSLPAAAHEGYRTRHRQVVRGPELAVLEGGSQDLVPPSDDEEYDAWRALRAVEEQERFVGQPPTGAQDEAEKTVAVAGPSRIPMQQQVFRPLFEYTSSVEFSDTDDNDEWQGSGSGNGKGKGKARASPPGSPSPRRAVMSDLPLPDVAPRPTQPILPESAKKTRTPLRLEDNTPRKRPRSPSPSADELGEAMFNDPTDPPRPSSQSSAPYAERSPSPDPISGDVEMPLASPQLLPNPAPLSPWSSLPLQAPTQPNEHPPPSVTPAQDRLSSPPPLQPPSLPTLARQTIPLSSPRAPLASLSPSQATNLVPLTPRQGGTTSSLPPPTPSRSLSPLPASASRKQDTPRQLTQPLAERNDNFDFEESQLPLSTFDRDKSSLAPKTAPAVVRQDTLPPLVQYDDADNVPCGEESQLPRGASQIGTRMDLDDDFGGVGAFESSTRAPSILSVSVSRSASPAFWVEIPTRSAPARAANAQIAVDATSPPRQPAPPPPRDDTPDPLDLLGMIPSRPSAPSQSMSPQRPATQPQRDPFQSRPTASGGRRTQAQPLAPPPVVQRVFLPEDPALRQFRIARTFRTRTALQLQPYTREKQEYERALQRGGLAKGKRAVAPVSVVAANKDTDTSDSADQSDGGDDDATPPDAIVIGGTQDTANKQKKQREPKQLEDDDYDEYFIRFGAVPDDDDPEAASRLQVIARERLKAAKERRRALRAADKARKEFEELIGGRAGNKDKEEKEKEAGQRREEKERRKAEREREAAERLKKRAEREKQRADKEKLRQEKAANTKTKQRPDRLRQGGTVAGHRRVYGKRIQQQPKQTVNFDDSSELSDPPPSDTEPAPRPAPAPARAESPTAFLRRLSPNDDDGFGGGFDAFDAPMPFDDSPMPSPSRRPAERTQRRRLSSSGSEADTDPRRRRSPARRSPVRRTARRSTRSVISVASGSDSDEDSGNSGGSEPEDHVDRRERIARRMLPGVMLKRLAVAEQDKQRKRAREAAERKRLAENAAAPARPGHAVRRRGRAGRDGLEGIDDLFDDEDESLEQERTYPARERGERRDRGEGSGMRNRDRGSSRPGHRYSSAARSRDTSPTNWRSRPPRRHPDDDQDADLLLEPADIDLSFSVHGSPDMASGTATAPIPFELDASESDGASRRSPSPTPGPIVISSGSEAGEDNTETLAFLHRGDFEAILRGRPGDAVLRGLDHKQQTDREKRRRRTERPVLRRIRQYDDRDGKLVQTRLDLQPVRGSAWGNGAVPEAGAAGAARRTRGQMKITDYDADKRRVSAGRPSDRRERTDRERGKTARRRGPRPAIRLDDTTIFATEEFAFESEPEATPPPAVGGLGKRAFTRVPSRGQKKLHNNANPRQSPISPHTPRGAGRATTPHTHDISPLARTGAATPRARLDDGVGKARSWANFERFPIDFKITPLPSGVYLSGPVIADLPEFLASLGGTTESDLKPLHTFGVHLHATMDLVEAVSVLPIVLDGAQTALRAYIDDPDRDAGSEFVPLHSVLAPLCFFRDFLVRSDAATKTQLHKDIQAFDDKLDDINLTSRSEDRLAVDQMLLVRYTLLQIALAAAPAPTDVPAATKRLFSLLLTYGFDRTLKSVRRVLRGEVDRPEITDNSLSIWVAMGHLLAASRGDDNDPTTDIFAAALLGALEARYAGEIGPLAAERVWFLVFGLCALNQFNASGSVEAEYTPYPRWGLVKRAIGLIKVTHSQETEEAAHIDQLQGRDRYIKTMVARCLRLSSAWAWSFDRQSFSVATRDLGVIFKERQHRNLPTEPPADFPTFISEYDISLTAADNVESTRRASAFELYLRLASVAASDVIASAVELSEAQRAERDVQRLIMSIFPLSAVPFSRASPPTARQLGALINRFSTMVVACYFSPSLLPWLLNNSGKWIDFKQAGFESRQVVIRGLMYLAVAVRHHSAALDPVVARLADILAILQTELDALARPGSLPRFHPNRVEVERTMVLVVTAFRQIIQHPGYAQVDRPVYPDPTLLHECWIARVFALDLAKDPKSGLEIVSTIQAYLDARVAALPKRAAAARRSAHESVDDYPSLGFDFNDIDLAALGDEEAQAVVDPIEEADARFAVIVRDTINPKIYRLLNDMLPPVLEKQGDDEVATSTDRQVLVGKLTKCWSDCAVVVVVEHRLIDWSAYVGPFGQQSWSRLGNEAGRVQVGLHFMLNVAQLDPSAFRTQEEEFLALLFQALVADRLTIQHKYVGAVLSIPGALEHALLLGLRGVLSEHGIMRSSERGEAVDVDFTRTTFLEQRPHILRGLFGNLAPLLRSRQTPSETKSLVYRCINTVVAAMASTEAAIDPRRVLPREAYRAFVSETLGDLRRAAGDYVTPMGVPALKGLEWVGKERK